MTWRDTETAEQRERAASLAIALGLPHHARTKLADVRGSRGGAPIWVCGAAFTEEPVSIRFKGSACNKCGSSRHLSSAHDAAADPDGFAVFGRYPRGFLAHVLKLRLLGDVRRDEVLHVCSGTLGPAERWTVDCRRAARPAIVANGCALPFRESSFAAVMLDPPYSDTYARNLYGTANPRPSWLLREAARVTVGGGLIGILHVAVPFAPRGTRLVRVFGVSTGVGFRIRAFTVFQKRQRGLFS